MNIQIQPVYRAYIWKNLVKHYANRVVNSTKVIWLPMRDDTGLNYPDHFKLKEVNTIRMNMMVTHNKSVFVEKVYLDARETAD